MRNGFNDLPWRDQVAVQLGILDDPISIAETGVRSPSDPAHRAYVGRGGDIYSGFGQTPPPAGPPAPADSGSKTNFWDLLNNVFRTGLNIFQQKQAGDLLSSQLRAQEQQRQAAFELQQQQAAAAAQQGSSTTKYLLIGGGVLAAVILLTTTLKK